MSDIFTSEENQNQASLLETLVGDGKKFKTTEDLARGKAEADQFIESLKTELQELKTDLGARDSVEEALRKAAQLRQPDPDPRNTREPSEGVAPSRDELIALVREVNQREQAEQISTRNVNEVSSKMAEVYGSPEKASEAVRAKAAELGVTTEFLQSVASKSPKAFFRQFDIDSAARSTPGVSTGNVSTTALGQNSQGPKEGTYEFYENLRKTDRALYYSPKVQIQLHKDIGARLQRGEALRS